MSKMLRSDRKPPLAAVRSPIRLRPRRALHSTTNNNLLQTSPGSLTKSHLPKRWTDVEEFELRPEYRTISCELRALAKMVYQEFGENDVNSASVNANRSPLFERGRFYEEYAAKRNERLKRKKNDEKKSALGVRVESAKRREVKKLESVRKTTATVMSTPVTERMREGEMTTVSRYSLRSSSCKENMKPPLSVKFERSVDTVERKTTAVRRSGRNL